jgi:wyosine [tRNA(Phe)-imidazoG37] synthetase (radical SAM superfamily)
LDLSLDSREWKKFDSMKHLFGPVNSRRLGLSQGIDLLPPKTCNFNCIYCEINAAPQLSCERGEHVPTDIIIEEINGLLANRAAVAKLDVFTITASGEPTLHTGIGRVVRYLKENTDKPVAILTNGSLLHMQEVREDLKEADIIIPSLDAARPASFRKVNRPAKCIAELEQIISGLEQFSQEFGGQIWLEVLFVKNMNDSPEDIEALLKAIGRINPSRVQLNTVARPPYETFAEPLDKKRMHEIKQQIENVFEGPVDVLAGFEEDSTAEPAVGDRKPPQAGPGADARARIINLLQRRPCTAADIAKTLGIDKKNIAGLLADMEKNGTLKQKIHGGKRYYRTSVLQKEEK